MSDHPTPQSTQRDPPIVTSVDTVAKSLASQAQPWNSSLPSVLIFVHGCQPSDSHQVLT